MEILKTNQQLQQRKMAPKHSLSERIIHLKFAHVEKKAKLA